MALTFQGPNQVPVTLRVNGRDYQVCVEPRGMYLKTAERGSWDLALVSLAVQLYFSGQVVEKARAALGGVAPVPWQAREAENVLLGNRLTDHVIEQAARAATAGARALAQNGYKIDLAQGLVRQALRGLR